MLYRSPAARSPGSWCSPATGAAVVGIGLNVSTRQAELPVETATSLLVEGHPELDRAELLVAFLGRFDGLYTAWQAHGGDAGSSGLAAGYRTVCATLGNEVSVELGNRTLSGRAAELDDGGRLLVQPAGGGTVVPVAGRRCNPCANEQPLICVLQGRNRRTSLM